MYVSQIPIRKINFSDSVDIAKHNKMITLVEQMIEMNKKLDNSKLAAEKEMIQRRIGVIDKEINMLVYQLYGLTEEEIKIIETK